MSTTHSTRHELSIQISMLAAVALIYLWFPTRNYFFDGIAFAQVIEENPLLHPYLFHPNHLVYNMLGSIFYHLILGLGMNIRAVAALQILNSLLSALCAYVLLIILKFALRSRYLCYALTLLFAFSATWWKFSTDADAYIPSVLFLLLSFNFALPSRKSRPFLLAVLYAISLCFHQIAIVFFPVLVLALFIQSPSNPPARRFINPLLFAVASCGLTLGAYASAFYLLTKHFQIKGFARWMSSYAPDESFGFHPLDNLGFTIRGHFRLFFGGKLAALKGLMNPLIEFLMLILLAVVLVLAVRVIRSRRNPGLQWFQALRRDAVRRNLALLCGLWISAYVIFLFFIAAHHTFYRLFYLPAIIILFGLGLDSYNSVAPVRRRYRLALFVAGVFLANFLALIYPYSYVQNYPPLVLALELNQAWPHGSIVYYGSANSDNSLVKYFNPGMEWKQLGAEPVPQLEDELRQHGAGNPAVWLETSGIDQLSSTPEGKDWLERHQKPGSYHGVVSKAHNIRFVQVSSAKQP